MIRQKAPNVFAEMKRVREVSLDRKNKEIQNFKAMQRENSLVKDIMNPKSDLAKRIDKATR